MEPPTPFDAKRSLFIISKARASADWRISGSIQIEFLLEALHGCEKKAKKFKFCNDIRSFIYICDFPWFLLKLMWLASWRSVEHRQNISHCRLLQIDLNLQDIQTRGERDFMNIDCTRDLRTNNLPSMLLRRCNLFTIFLRNFEWWGDQLKLGFSIDWTWWNNLEN